MAAVDKKAAIVVRDFRRWLQTHSLHDKALNLNKRARDDDPRIYYIEGTGEPAKLGCGIVVETDTMDLYRMQVVGSDDALFFDDTSDAPAASATPIARSIQEMKDFLIRNQLCTFNATRGC